MRCAVVLVITMMLIGCLHKPPAPDLPKGPVIEYGRPGVVTQ